MNPETTHRLVRKVLITLAEITDHQQRLKVDPDLMADFNQIVDATEATFWDITSDEARTIPQQTAFARTSRVP